LKQADKPKPSAPSGVIVLGAGCPPLALLQNMITPMTHAKAKKKKAKKAKR
jgi:hypothetical protein